MCKSRSGSWEERKSVDPICQERESFFCLRGHGPFHALSKWTKSKLWNLKPVADNGNQKGFSGVRLLVMLDKARGQAGAGLWDTLR